MKHVVVVLLAVLGGCSRVRSSTPMVEVKKAPFTRQVTAEGYLRAVKSTPLSAPTGGRGGQKIAWMVRDGSKVAKGDVVLRFDPTELEKKLQDGQADRAAADAKIAKETVTAGAAVRDRNRTAEMSSAELEKQKQFASKDTLIFSRNQIAESAIDEGLSIAKVDHANATKTIESSLSASKVDLIAVEKRKAELQVKLAEKGLASIELRAPHDGIIVFEQDWRGNLPHVGDTVWPGQTVASLPLLDEMEAEVFVLEADASGLAVGNPASVTLESHPEPPFDGKVARIDSLAKPRVREVPIQYFGATIGLSTTDRERMKPGERVHALLTLEAKEALTVPRQAVFEREGNTVVYRAQNGKLEPVVVKLGASTPGSVVIEDGLKDGDRIATEAP